MEISPKKLQKIMYYVYAWGLVFLNETGDDLQESIFDGKFEAWVHGPVDPDIYREYANYGYEPINTGKITVPKIHNEVVADVLDQVWNTYSQFSANQLERLTHSELPWKEGRKGLDPFERAHDRIDDVVIFNYYGNELAR
ncbi:SocA family protein [Weissella uvarum]|nr:SocA family protein [Weissella uvarum]